MKFIFIFSLFICFGLNTSAQKNTSGDSNSLIGMHLQSGFIMPHREEMKHLVQGHSVGASVSILKKSRGNKYWQHAYNFPEQGLDLWFIRTGNPQQLGTQFDTKYLLNLPLNQKLEIGSNQPISAQKKFKHWLGLGIGLGYSSKKWDLRENHQAAVLGSHFNASLTIQYSVSIFRKENFDLRSGIRISHFSNGASQIPNLGTNNFGVFVGFYLHKNQMENPVEYDLKPELEKWRNTLSLVAGIKEIQPPMSRKYPTFSLTYLRERRITYKSSIGAGLDLFYNSSLVKLMERENSISKNSEALQAGLLLSYSMHFDRFELKMQNGIYLHTNWKNDGPVYHRFGLRYRCTEKLFTQFTLKTHFAKADFMELGFGYAF